jgi:hypothetical protein
MDALQQKLQDCGTEHEARQAVSAALGEIQDVASLRAIIPVLWNDFRDLLQGFALQKLRTYSFDVDGEAIEVILDLVPFIFPEDFFECLRRLVQQKPAAALYPVLRCLFQRERRTEVLEITKANQTKLECVPDTHLVDTVRMLLECPEIPEQASFVLNVVRSHSDDRDTDLVYSVANLIFWAFEGENGSMLLSVYFRMIQDVQDKIVCLLDSIVVLLLWESDSKGIAKIFETWLLGGRFPFRLLSQLATLMPEKETLLRLVVFLFLAPIRISWSIEKTSYSAMVDFCLALSHTNPECVVRSLMALMEEVPGDTRIQQSAYDVLTQIALTEPTAVGDIQQHLTQSLYRESYSAPAICAILVGLFEQNLIACSDLMALLQKLLFSGAIGDTSQIVRGFQLGTDLVQSEALPMKEKEIVRDWIRRILLPCSRRMMAFELGPPGLKFLQTCSDDFFLDLKELVANTGLVQMLANYQLKPECALAYTTYAPETGREISAEKPRGMVFCINYFLETIGMTTPAQMGGIARWVYELIDTYLCTGRRRTTSWRPDGWLLACVEVPKIVLPIASASIEQEAALARINDLLFDFDISNGIKKGRRFPFSTIDQLTSRLVLKSCRSLLDCVERVALSLLICIPLLTAVLNNTFEHLRALRTSEIEHDVRKMTQLLKFNLSKLYDLRSRSEAIDYLLVSLHSVVERASPRERLRTKSNRRSGESQSLSVSLFVVARGVFHIGFLTRFCCRPA